MSARVAPNFSCLRRYWFRQAPGFPRWFLLPPATPAMEDLGCPLSCISGWTGDRSSSRPDSLSFGGAGCESSRLPPRFAPPVSPTISIQVALNAHPPAPADGMSEFPRIAHHPVRLGGISRLLRLSALATLINQFPGRPKSRVSQRSPIRFRLESPRNSLPRLIRICFRESPRFRIYS